ncbi:MAG: hypothetical protein IPG86_21420 [Chitinophagaceae bacterium]|nr:hypothetical protein [Chitinophagaceae bacterium]
MVTVVPTGPLAGLKVITGGANHVKPGSVELPPGLVTDYTPVAPPTMAWILVDELTVNEIALTPPTVTQ